MRVREIRAHKRARLGEMRGPASAVTLAVLLAMAGLVQVVVADGEDLYAGEACQVAASFAESRVGRGPGRGWDAVLPLHCVL